jgi:hypothetical protein
LSTKREVAVTQNVILEWRGRFKKAFAQPPLLGLEIIESGEKGRLESGHSPPKAEGDLSMTSTRLNH